MQDIGYSIKMEKKLAVLIDDPDPSTITREEFAAALFPRIKKLEKGHEDLKKDVSVIMQNTAEIIELFNNIKVAFNIFCGAARWLQTIVKWLSSVGIAGAVIWGIWFAITKIGPPPPSLPK